MIRQSEEKSEHISYGEKRAFKRIPANIDARFFYGNTFYSGVIRNLSDHGMFIDTKKSLPSDSMFVVILREDNDLLKVTVKVKRFPTNSDSCLGMGVELIGTSSGYVEFFHRLCAPSKELD